MSYQPNKAAYRTWQKNRSEDLLTLQDEHPPIWNMLISVAIAAAGDWTDADLQATLQSLHDQSWHNLEVVIFAGGRNLGSRFDTEAASFLHLRGLTIETGRVAADIFRSGPAACGLRGDYVMVVAPGSTFVEAAFSTLNRTLVEGGGQDRPDLVLFDHEYADQDGNDAYPVFLPGFDAEFLAASDYIGGAVLIRSALLEGVAHAFPPTGLRDALLAAANSDPGLRITHIRDILMRLPGMPPNADDKAAQSMAPATPKAASIAVIIPNRNQATLLAQCVESLLPNPLVKELIVVDNASDSQDTLDLYEALKRDHGAKIVEANQPFNFSRMINLGVEAASADMLLLLNNDIEFRNAETLAQTCAVALRPEVGIVGSKLLYPDGTIQHAGVLLDYHPREYAVRAMHIGRGAERSSAGYLGQYGHARQLLAVTGAFMMLRRAVFDEVGGFDEVALPVEFNDIDFCLRVGKAGYKILCLPLDGVFHHESASRGKADTAPVRRMRAAAQALMARRWLSKFQNDPYNHPVARLGEKAEVQFNFTGTFIG